jgi:glutamate N-acetyltransferase/amino-acid N-acetyltransferase
MAYTWISDGGITTPRGYRASGVKARIKGDKGDVALVVSSPPATVAAVFTTNRIQGATVGLCRDRLAAGRPAAAIVVNSGCANACTGAQGKADAQRMAELTGNAVGASPDRVWVCSTGTIGVPLPMDKIEKGIALAAGALSETGGGAAARAIMTTDTVSKSRAVTFEIAGRSITVGGMAKGAGMIEPHMATMLAFLTTDAAVERAALGNCLRRAVDASFNRISVDGDQSCNDTVLLLANGAAGHPLLTEGDADWPAFEDAVCGVCRELALDIVRDGEGATKLVTVRIVGADDAADAERAVRAVSRSLLVKTSWFGGDPNWGRVIDAVGYSGARIEEALVTIDYDGVRAFEAGVPSAAAGLRALEAVLRQQAFTLTVDLHLGNACAVMYTCDCSEEYVRINSEYMT